MSSIATPAPDFGRKASAYANRPVWPDSFMRYVAERAGIEPGMHLAEFGTGPGHSADYFVRQGVIVHGIDINAAMREAAMQRFADFNNFISIEGSALEPNLGDGIKVDFISAAQAAHWWHDDREEVLKVWQSALKEDGRIIVLSYNPHKDCRLADDVHDFFKTELQLYRDSKTPLRDAPALSASNALFYVDQTRDFIHEPDLHMCTITPDLEGFLNLMDSYSFTPDPDTDESEALRPRLRQIFHQHQKGGVVEIHYMAEMVMGYLRRGPAVV